MGLVTNLTTEFLCSVTSSIRKFTAFLFLIVIIGMMLGAHVYQADYSSLSTIIIIPAILALIAYFYTEAAIVFFVAFMVLFLLI